MTAETIKSTVADYFKVSIEAMESRTRKGKVIEAKHIAIYCLRLFTKMSFREIDREFNLKQHETLIHAIRSVNNQSDTYPLYRNQLKKIVAELERKLDTDFDKYKQYETDKI